MPRSGGKIGSGVAFGLVLTIFCAVFSHRSTSSSSRSQHTQSQTDAHHTGHAPRTRASHTTRRCSASDVATCIHPTAAPSRAEPAAPRARARTATAPRSVHRSPTLTGLLPSAISPNINARGNCSRPRRVVPASARAATRARGAARVQVLSRDCHAIIAAEAHTGTRRMKHGQSFHEHAASSVAVGGWVDERTSGASVSAMVDGDEAAVRFNNRGPLCSASCRRSCRR